MQLNNKYAQPEADQYYGKPKMKTVKINISVF